ncbi:hypothetical protein Mgra_00007512 [Meloidogyne graminicola]|uniref:Uncharacterized protein n=1 Tax=Meloidogyne graminicola TaxID=189291 RepID=A0A8S9ZIP1_9BILA|nr:hypothetical protein Mgra_00007512 [Meloidogyne graminicola]
MFNTKIFENNIPNQSTKVIIKTTNPKKQHYLLKKVSLLILFPLMFIQIINCFTFCLAENNNKAEEIRRWSNGVGLWGKRSLPTSGSHDILNDPTQKAFLFKRPENSWNKLNALWGKRSSVGLQPSLNWQTATGLWGKKRSVIKPIHDNLAFFDFINLRN